MARRLRKKTSVSTTAEGTVMKRPLGLRVAKQQMQKKRSGLQVAQCTGALPSTPKTGYSAFCCHEFKMLDKELAALPPKQRFKELAARWRALPQEQRAEFARQAKTQVALRREKAADLGVSIRVNGTPSDATTSAKLPSDAGRFPAPMSVLGHVQHTKCNSGCPTIGYEH